MSDTIDATFSRFDCVELIHTEYKRRVISQRNNISDRRLRSFFCLSIPIEIYSKIEIEKYYILTNKVGKKINITLNGRIHCGVIVHKNTIFVMGGKLNGIVEKSVSKQIQKNKKNTVAN